MRPGRDGASHVKPDRNMSPNGVTGSRRGKTNLSQFESSLPTSGRAKNGQLAQAHERSIGRTSSRPQSRDADRASIPKVEKQLQEELLEAQRDREDLERTLQQERDAAAADRHQLARLAIRIEQLENSREMSSRLLEDNRHLRNELEAQTKKVNELTDELDALRGSVQSPIDPLSAAQTKLLEENSKLRYELQMSQIMMAKYTEELSQIMPGVELILAQWQKDGSKGCEDDNAYADNHGGVKLERSAPTVTFGVPEVPAASPPGITSSRKTEFRAQAVVADGQSDVSGLRSGVGHATVDAESPKRQISPMSPTRLERNRTCGVTATSRPRSSARRETGTRRHSSTSPQPSRVSFNGSRNTGSRQGIKSQREL